VNIAQLTEISQLEKEDDAMRLKLNPCLKRISYFIFLELFSIKIMNKIIIKLNNIIGRS